MKQPKKTKKKKDPNRGYTKQEHASDNRKLARAMYPKTKKKKGETKAEKTARKTVNKQKRKIVRKSGRAATGNAKGNARKNLH